MKSMIIASLVASAAAFAPAQEGRTSTAVNADLSKEIGAMAPLGFYDPLGLCADGNKEQFDLYREYELTHGRVAMLAVVGYLTTAAGIRFPGAGDVPAGLKAFEYLAASKDGQNVLLQMLAFMAIATIVNRDADWIDNEAEFIGDYRNGALDFGWDKFDEETKIKKRTIEINNGRAAMMGIAGLYYHEVAGVSVLPGGWLP